MTEKAPDAFRTISEAAEIVGVPAHTLRHWETLFPIVRPTRRSGGRRFYRPRDLHIVAGLHQLMNEEGYSVAGVRKMLQQRGVAHLIAVGTEHLKGPGTPASSRTVEVRVEDLRALLRELKSLKATVAKNRCASHDN